MALLNIPIHRYIESMAYIGKDPLPQETQARIEKELLDFALHSKKKISSTLLVELLTDTERTMLAKRFAAVLLLCDDTSYYTIENILGMST